MSKAIVGNEIKRSNKYAFLRGNKYFFSCDKSNGKDFTVEALVEVAANGLKVHSIKVIK